MSKRGVVNFNVVANDERLWGWQGGCNNNNNSSAIIRKDTGDRGGMRDIIEAVV